MWKRRGFEKGMGAHGFGVRNQEGERILELCQSKELRMINMMFKRTGNGKLHTRVEEQKHKLSFYC